MCNAGRAALAACLLGAVATVAAASRYEHPLLKGGGDPATAQDFQEKFAAFLKNRVAGAAGEELLTSYFGKDRRNRHFPDLVVAYGKGQPHPAMALIYKGHEVNRLPNEPYLWVMVFVEEGAALLSQPAATPRQVVKVAGEPKDACLTEASQLQVRLEGLAYEKEKESDVNITDLIKAYTGEKPAPVESKPLNGACAAVDFSQMEPRAGVHKVLLKFALSKEAMYRLIVYPTGARQSSEYHFGNMGLSWLGAGVGPGAFQERRWFEKASVKPYVFGHFYVSKLFSQWNRSLAFVAGVPVQDKLNELCLGLRWSPLNEWTAPDFARFGLIAGYDYHRPIDRYAGSRKHWRFFAGLDYRL